MQKLMGCDYENGTGSQIMNLELGINEHFNLCYGPKNADVENCSYCRTIEIVYRIGYNNGWQEAHETWETQ